MESSIPLKEKFNVTHGLPRNKRHSSPHSTRGALSFGQEEEAGARGRHRPQPLLGSLWERLDREKYTV